MRAFVVSDAHINSRALIHGAERFDEDGENLVYQASCRALEWCMKYANQDDIMIVAGDLFDTHNPRPEDICAVIDIIGRSSAQVFLVPGNHEYPLRGRGPMDVVEAAHPIFVKVANETMTVNDKIKLLPYQRRPGPSESDVEDLIRFGERKNTVLVFHGTVEGGFADAKEWSIPKRLFDSFEVVVAGHNHVTSYPYAGPLAPRTHAEESVVPGMMKLTWEEGRINVDRVEVPDTIYKYKLQTIKLPRGLTPGQIKRAVAKRIDMSRGRLFLRVEIEEFQSPEITSAVRDAVEEHGVNFKMKFSRKRKDRESRLGVDPQKVGDAEVIMDVARSMREESDLGWVKDFVAEIQKETKS